ncbi:MAG: hypothetical protein HC921_20850 [Synechococcaceae cyanobacterium SM2_3_1]|nr:hypothetical protein [Synechococcaceae cyanobacterium SM2_3_1]
MAYDLPIVTDLELLDRLFGLVKTTIDKHVHINLEWLISKKFVAVPIDRDLNSFFSWSDNEISYDESLFNFFLNLSICARTLGCEFCYAIPTDRAPVYKVKLSTEQLDNFWHKCNAFNYVLMPIDQSFLLLWSAMEYIILSGPKDFVEGVLGCNLEVAKERFRHFAKYYRDNPYVTVVGLTTPEKKEHFYSKLERNLLLVLERYEICNV